MNKEQESRIKDILISLPSLKLTGLKQLFWEELNYNQDNSPVSQATWSVDFSKLFVESPVSLATYANNDGFHVLSLHLNSEKLLISTERQIIATLIVDHPYSLFIFSNLTQDRWHFVNAVQNPDQKRSKQFILRRISISKDDRLRTACERIARLDVSSIEQSRLGVSPIQIQKLHEEAFNVEAVTEEFFAEYKAVFTKLMTGLETQSADRTWAHDFSLQFMNRLMFIYYLERKGWLGDDPDFLHNFWREYQKLHKGSDSFVDEWLNILFFEAFNKKFSAGRSDYQYLPERYRTALQLAPYLNGGLFSKNELDEKHNFTINDEQIGSILAFLDKYNFTISEDTPLDQEVAVDPEMIGKVYESLVNVSAEADEQSDAGIFYTPRIEIDLMCRLSLVDWLSNHLPEISKNSLYELVFAFNPYEKRDADRAITVLDLWPRLNELLSGLTVLDPACGSGSFLVGMLAILDDLLVRANQHLGKEETPYERRKRIIGSSLYGVDIMDWAVHVAELRLWLQLVIETELDLGERTCQALLPNLSFKLRQGDSLVQEVGGLNLSMHRQGGQIKLATANQIKTLKEEKLKYFQNDPERKYRTKAELSQAEFRLFEQVLADQIRTLEARQTELEDILNPREGLFGVVQAGQMDLDSPKMQQEFTLVAQNLEALRSARHILQTQKSIPFVWDVAFVEIFDGEKGGFDIVIGNPPYTRQEAIRDLSLSPKTVTKENKSAYKTKLAEAVYAAWPKTFGLNLGKVVASLKLNKKSDLYIYFYFIGLSLVNPQGSFCFITSNAWLDVGYGSDLQRFLLTRSKIKLIVDNQVRRSFKSADVNTIIALLASPRDSRNDLKPSIEHTARFVMFKVPFENGLSPVLWEEVEDAQARRMTTECRIEVKKQKELLETGLDEERGVYAGDKWGGKYLRAPDIYWTIIEKCAPKIVRLGKISHIRRGITTGANKFFYISKDTVESWGIEKEYLIPLIKSPKECNSIQVDPEGLNNYIFVCNKSKQELKNSNALRYIEWGEAQKAKGGQEDTGINLNQNPTLRNKKLWYSIQEKEPMDFLCNRFFGDRFFFSYINNVIEDQTFYGGKLLVKNKYSQVGILNSTLQFLFIELYGRVGLGEGVLQYAVYEMNNLITLDTDQFDASFNLRMKQALEKIKNRPINNIWTECGFYPSFENNNPPNPLSDRLALDKIIFDEIGLLESERFAVYKAVCELVYNRAQKAVGI